MARFLTPVCTTLSNFLFERERLSFLGKNSVFFSVLLPQSCLSHGLNGRLKGCCIFALITLEMVFYLNLRKSCNLPKLPFSYA